MELGEKIRQARLEAGLSQRQLCGEEITRNMLSQIEHGTAKPSMKTLSFLAARLEKPISYFLDEEIPMLPDRKVLEAISCLTAAEDAIAGEKYPYARQLLERAESGYEFLERQRLLLLGRLPGEDLLEIVDALPSLDEELLLRAEGALDRREEDLAQRLLAAAENREHPRWHLLRGRLLLAQKQYTAACVHLTVAETAYPEVCIPLLEACYRELGDFQQAYHYACKQK